MSETTVVHDCEKLSQVWCRARGRHVMVRIRYDLRREGGCEIYALRMVEALD